MHSKQHIKAREVELRLASVQRARTTRAKIRNLMSVLFNHARGYDQIRDAGHFGHSHAGAAHLGSTASEHTRGDS
jgi:hypothetical protein